MPCSSTTTFFDRDGGQLFTHAEYGATTIDSSVHLLRNSFGMPPTVHEPITTNAGQRTAGLRLGDRRVHALLQALLVFRLLPAGFRNRDLHQLLGELLGRAPGDISAGQVSYDLRRLRAHGLITRIPRTHQYRLSDTDGDHAMLLTHIHNRLLQPGLAQLTDQIPPATSALRAAAHTYQRALDQLTKQAGFAA